VVVAVVLVTLAALPVAARAGSSTEFEPVVAFAEIGSHEVTLEVCNEGECSQVTQVIQVLDPTPRIVGTPTALPAISEVGQLVHFVGAGEGKPPLTFTWAIHEGTTLVASLNGPDVVWDTTGREPGLYTATFEVANLVAGLPAADLSTPLFFTLEPERASDFYTVTPCRILDTRSGAPLANGVRREIQVAASSCGIPQQARAVTGNVTVLASASGGHVAVFPGNYPTPATSVVNFAAGQVRANFAVLPLATDGSGALAALAGLLGDTSVDLILDVSGYFMPPVQPPQ
jgi:hypothetical protein